ncbi:IS66 family insertion sequence element accessory protein TnpA [Sphingobacterium humi]|uniref:IS66 family insertion sequence element accessory protein TnpA n=1 Tax=Sphingobacterium humi TaxID=1796905 RepID=UPI003CCDE9BE
MNLSISKRERMLSLVDQWRRSGQTRKDFCLSHGLKVCTLGYWIKRNDEQNSDPGFKEVLLAPQPSGRIEIVYPNGVKINAGGDLNMISRLIHLY